MGGRRLGNKAILWGVVLGTLPDLDIIAYPWLDHIERLEWHRGWSHSLFLMLVASPAIGWLVSKIHKGKVGMRRAAWTVFAILATHVLIDVFTVYGTMVFAPFSDYRAGWNNLFIIDPLFTTPLLLGILIACISRKNQSVRRWANISGLALATLYAGWSLAAKAIAEDRMRDELANAGISYDRFVSNPTPFNTILWRGLAERDQDFVITYYSFLNPNEPPAFDFIPKNHQILAPIAGSREAKRLAWFSDGFFSVHQTSQGWLVSDWRFGEWRSVDDPFSEANPPVSIFSWVLRPEENRVKVTPVRPMVDYPAQLQRLARRMIPGSASKDR